jgi:hypothetical protein
MTLVIEIAINRKNKSVELFIAIDSKTQLIIKLGFSLLVFYVEKLETN